LIDSIIISPCVFHTLAMHVDESTFFFRAEVGIRDFHVTGVQTCALPISLRGLAEGLIDRAKIDAVARSAGFPVAGGISGLITSRGRAAFLARCAELASRHGKRFALPEGAFDEFSTEA